MRSAVPIHSTGTSARLGTGLPSSARTLKVWPGRARLRISVALPLRTWNSTRCPVLTLIGSPWPSARPLMLKAR